MPLYDTIGYGSAAARREDPRIAAHIRAALESARAVVNIGAGTNYEPVDLDVVAIEPSLVMIGQRPPGKAPAVAGVAESIPLDDQSVDAAMTVVTDQRWSDWDAGFREMLRVARRRVVAVTFDSSHAGRFWLSRDYLPYRSDARPDPNLFELMTATNQARIQALQVARDGEDAFYDAYWRRPAAYLDQCVRDGISVFHRLGQDRRRRDAAPVAGSPNRCVACHQP